MAGGWKGVLEAIGVYQVTSHGQLSILYLLGQALDLRSAVPSFAGLFGFCFKNLWAVGVPG